MEIASIAISKKKGTRKVQVEEASLIQNHGLEGDAHAGPWHRQVSFLASESIQRARETGLDVSFGDFAENVATEGIAWHRLPVGTRVRLGQAVVVEVSQIGKTCHDKCEIYKQVGRCVMPKEGIFGKVLEAGVIKKCDGIHIKK